MTKQTPNYFINEYPMLPISHYAVTKVCDVDPSDDDYFTRGRSYSYRKPIKTTNAISSSCWRGYVGQYTLTAHGAMVFDWYKDLSNNRYQMNEDLTGDFWVEFENTRRSDERIFIPFLDGKVVTNPMKWKGSEEHLYYMRQRKLRFQTYEEALDFLRRIKVGCSRPSEDASYYQWDSEGSILNEDQLHLIDSHNCRFIWTDPGTGLAWLFRPWEANTVFRGYDDRLDSIRYERFAGYDDWRLPSIDEIKTLSSPRPNEHGVYVKPALSGILDGAYTASTSDDWYLPYFNTVWNFDSNPEDAIKYRESKNRINEDGDYTDHYDEAFVNYPGSSYCASEKRIDEEGYCDSLGEIFVAGTLR